MNYIIENPSCINTYTQIVGNDVLEYFRQGNRGYIQRFFMHEYNSVKTIYTVLGNPITAILYSDFAIALLPYLSIEDIAVAIFLSYVAELYIAHGSINPKIKSILDLAEKNAEKAPCSIHIRINVLANIYLLRSISEKALGNTVEAYNLLSATKSDKWIKSNSNDYSLVAINRQQVMMTQSFQNHIDLLKTAEKFSNISPLEYYRTIKRVFEYAINRGYKDSTIKLMPRLLLAFSYIQNSVPPIVKISLLKNLGQANAILGDKSLAIKQLNEAIKEANNKELKGQIIQIKRIIEAIKEGNAVGSLVTFKMT